MRRAEFVPVPPSSSSGEIHSPPPAVPPFEAAFLARLREKKLIDAPGLDRALRLQETLRGEGIRKPLPHLLWETGAIDELTLRALLDDFETANRRIGESANDEPQPSTAPCPPLSAFCFPPSADFDLTDLHHFSPDEDRLLQLAFLREAPDRLMEIDRARTRREKFARTGYARTIADLLVDRGVVDLATARGWINIEQGRERDRRNPQLRIADCGLRNEVQRNPEPGPWIWDFERGTRNYERGTGNFMRRAARAAAAGALAGVAVVAMVYARRGQAPEGEPPSTASSSPCKVQSSGLNGRPQAEPKAGPISRPTDVSTVSISNPRSPIPASDSGSLRATTEGRPLDFGPWTSDFGLPRRGCDLLTDDGEEGGDGALIRR